MADTLPTIWPIEPHTAAKHKILRGYLNAWFPILARYPKAKRVLYVDGFSGPGEYSNGEEGSPIIAIKAALDQPNSFPTKIRLVFNEMDRERFEHLKAVVGRYKDQSALGEKNIELKEPFNEECQVLLNRTLETYEARKQKFGPALIFLDQFGYSDVPLDLVARIMRHENCEVFSYLHGDGIRRFLSDESKHPAISRAFGGDSWRKVLTLHPNQRTTFLGNEYKSVLKSNAGVKYVWHFAMHGEGNKLLYWLFFCTNHRRGLEEMKRAMAKVDTSGGNFSFSDASAPGQLVLFDQASDEWLANNLATKFGGIESTVEKIAEYVLESTPGTTYKKALQLLENRGKLEAVNPPKERRKGTFADESMGLRFK